MRPPVASWTGIHDLLLTVCSCPAHARTMRAFPQFAPATRPTTRPPQASRTSTREPCSCRAAARCRTNRVQQPQALREPTACMRVLAWTANAHAAAMKPHACAPRRRPRRSVTLLIHHLSYAPARCGRRRVPRGTGSILTPSISTRARALPRGPIAGCPTRRTPSPAGRWLIRHPQPALDVHAAACASTLAGE